MKRFLSAALALLMLLSLASCAPLGDGHGNIVFRTYFESSAEEYIFENGYLKLRFDPATTWFIVEDKITGEEWHSNPPNAAVDNADIITRRIMQSLLDINYSARDGNTARIDSFTFGVNKGFYEYEIHDNGFSVHFTVGDVERTFYIPQAVPEWRMNEITQDMTDSEIRDLTNKYGYRLYDLDRLFSFDNVDELMARFPDLEENRVFYMNPDTGTHLKEAAEMLFERYGYTYEDYYADLEFYETGRIVTDPVFNITVQVEIIDYELRVTVPFDSIEYRSEFPPVELSLLPYFGAGGLNDEGFMFVPDGSGALINFNNGKNNQNPYSNRIYGWDEGLSRDAIVLDPRAHFPVFGIEKNGSAMLCVIEEGTPYASIKAGVSGMGGSYNNVYAEYSVVSREQMEISGKSDKNVLIFQRDLPEGEGIVQRYFFCERNGYMGMAEKYREYLLERHPHLEKPAESVVPVAVEITGAVNKIQHVAGLPFDLPLKLTSYKEAADIVSDLDSRGFTDVNYRLTGWFNGSVQHAVPTNIRLISRLGNSRDLRDLVSTVNNLDSQIYLEADFLFMRDNKPFNSFSLNRDASRYINRKRVELYPYSYIWYGPMEWFKMARIARPVYMMGLIDGFIEQIASYGAQNVAFRTIGSHLTGDFNERRFVSREESMKMQVAKLQEMRENGNGIMLQSGYIYAAPYADFITDMPLSWQGFGILDEEIPFMQIVLHGLVPYAGRPVNLAEDYSMNILRSLESGAGLYFSFMHENPSVLQNSRYLSYYANQYSAWADTADALYKEFSEQVGDIYNQFITDYIILSDGVSVTEYENGVRVVVNKSRAPFRYEGQTIEPRDYLVLRGGN